MFDDKYDEDLNRVREQSNYDPTKYLREDRLIVIPDSVKENTDKDTKEENYSGSQGQRVKSSETNKTAIDGKIVNQGYDMIQKEDVLETQEYMIESKVVNFEDLDKMNLINIKDIGRVPDDPIIKEPDENRVESIPCVVKRLNEELQKRQI